MSWIKDGFVPVAGVLLALMGFIANRDANRRQELEAKAARQQKYLEYFLANYSESSPTRQSAAFALLKYMDPDVRRDLVYGLSANTDLSREAWRVLAGMDDVKLNFGVASTYRVEIYYGQNHAADATTIEKQLKGAGFEGDVVLGEKIPEFWNNYGWGEGNEVRYEPTGDSIAIKYFYRFIDAKNPSLQFHERAVPDTSRPHSIAVHLPPPH
jgi:hypothetical protein